MSYNFLDLFAGAGGLSEGFIRAGFMPVAHIDADKAACYTLKTRMAYKELLKSGREDIYIEYLSGKINRAEFYKAVPEKILDTVIHESISIESISSIFEKIDSLINNSHLDLIIGGPPCQAYSVIGRSRDKNKMIGDSRNYLYKLYAMFLEKYQPKYFVFENVMGLLSAKDINGVSYFEKMRWLFKEKGYSVEYSTINASDYGVLQNRRRIILIGKRGNHEGFYPEIVKDSINADVSEIFCDLPQICAGGGFSYLMGTLPYNGNYLYNTGIKRFDQESVSLHWARPHTERDLEIYRIAVQLWNNKKRRLNYNDVPEHLQTQKNKESFLDRFKVVAGNMPHCQTVVAHISKDGHYFIHPDIKQNRSLTPREAARLQTFPDDYYFESVSGEPGRTAAYKQIGNAVPVLLAEKIAKALQEEW